MTNHRQVVLIGAGAQAKYAHEIFSLTDDVTVKFVVADDGKSVDWPSECGLELLSGFDQLERFAGNTEVSGAIICMADPAKKKDLRLRAQQLGLTLISAIHPKSAIASTAKIAPGCIINAGAVVQPFALIEECVMIHANVVVEHDCIVRKFANLAPGVALAGWVEIGPGAVVFTGASVIPKCKIGANATVGAGATVIHDVADGARVAGTPAR